MIYVFDTSPLRALQHFYPTVFRTIWTNLNILIKSQNIISTKEVLNEIERQDVSDDVRAWVKNNKQIFRVPNADELNFVRQLFSVSHFQGLIEEKKRLKGTPVAVPFVIACAKVHQRTVITEERFKPNAAKIPNVCKHFKIPCMSLQEFMHEQGWKF